MLQCYVDESESENVLSLGGYISTPERWSAFSAEWEKALDHLNVGQPFKMGELMALHEIETKWTRITQLHDIIARHVMFQVAMTLETDALADIMADAQDEKVKKPYLFLLYEFMKCVFLRVLPLIDEHTGTEDKLSFVFDRGRDGNELRGVWGEFAGGAPSAVQKRMAGPPTFSDDQTCAPLQAADMKAWFARAHFLKLFHNGPDVPADVRRSKGLRGISIPLRRHHLIDMRAEYEKPFDISFRLFGELPPIKVSVQRKL